MATAAESAWSNGTCERLNEVIADIVDKIVAECHCDEEIALSWLYQPVMLWTTKVVFFLINWYLVLTQIFLKSL